MMKEEIAMRGSFLKLAESLMLGLTVYLMHQTIFVWFYAYNLSGGSPQFQLAVFVVLVLIVFWRMRLGNENRAFFNAWKNNWFVGLFLLLALLSLGWTVSLPATIYRSLLALFVALIASYVGIRFSARDLLNFVAIVVGVFALVSLFFVAFLPNLAIHSEWPYEGLWRGIFWHKIYLGATMALGYSAYLVILFSPRQQFTRAQKVFAAAMIVPCTVLAIFSDSASGLVVFAIQTGLFFAVLFWLQWGHLIPRRAYWFLSGFILLVFLLLVTNLDIVFGLFNRSANLTGRVPMWLHVIKTYVVERPFFGHGFGAFWLQPGIMQEISAVVGWKYPVRVSDNGYMDILLGLGITGLLVLLAILATGFWRAVRGAFQGHDLISFFPLFVLVHILFINISLSYFFENETFIWFLLVVVVFMTTPNKRISPSE
jgi:exopolysaccharide production protein ExoQ